MLSDIDQEGLFNSLDWIRRKAGVAWGLQGAYGKSGSIASGLLCPYCSSVWFGTVFTLLFLCNQRVTFFVTLPFAISTVAIFINAIHNKLTREE